MTDSREAIYDSIAALACEADYAQRRLAAVEDDKAARAWRRVHADALVRLNYIRKRGLQAGMGEIGLDGAERNGRLIAAAIRGVCSAINEAGEI